MAPRIDNTSSLMNRRAGAFSLVELLVVIAILTLLLGIGVAVGAGLRTRARVSQARGLLSSCQAIATEYQASTGSVVGGIGIVPFVNAVKGNVRTNTMLSNLGKAYDSTGNTIKDAWGNPLDYRPFLNANGAGPYLDHPSPFFVSAGPDGRFGNIVGGKPDKDAVDNLYSYEVK